MEVWKWLEENHAQIVSLANITIIIGAVVAAFSWINFLRNFTKFIFKILKKFFMNLINKIKSWLQEKIIGKENLGLLKELEILKGNKRAIEFLNFFNKENEATKVNGYYEALLAFMNLYSREMDFDEFKKAYEEDKEDRKRYGFDSQKIYKLRDEILAKLIEKYSGNNNNNN